MSETPDDPWLDAHEMSTWLAVVAMLQSLPPALDRALRTDAGITLFDYLVLAMLSQAPGRELPAAELARQVDGTLSRLSHALDRLAGHEWVTRRCSEHDGRVTLVTLTDAGFDVLRRCAPAHVRHVRALVFDGLPPEQVEALGAIAAAISSRARPQAHG